MIDAGAGYGYFTLLAAELAGPGGKVVAIEPHPHSAVLLRRNLALNGLAGQVEVVQAALAGPTAPLSQRLLVPPGGPLAAFLVPPHTEDTLAGFAVEIQTLDRWAPLRPDLVKLDLAGGEEAAWDGMQRLRAECPGVGVLCSFATTRCRAPEALLDAMAARIPLRALTPGGTARPAEKATQLDGGEAML